MIASAIFSWQSQAQKTIALSSTEAKYIYMALSDCSQQAVWIKALLNELGSYEDKTLVVTINMYWSDFNSKHIDICYHYIRQCLEDMKISLYFVEGAKNLADMFTKNLGKQKFLKFRDQLGFESW